MSRLSKEQITFNMPKIPGWKLNQNEIERTFEFEGFKEAISFINQVAEHAEELNHHPDIVLRHNKVSLLLTTQDVGGLTGRDFALAQRINKLLPSKGKAV
ncbi:4a-hydroxytetrahydrobiopterin dehydratase [Ammoniphilus sp. YIM 78166]|uniref:4a-hydroxytetrahydrobiopterin dehydratase n=1 Tax=Ammoniphilus sp. YIM 78166 TaxID=1644106 RepID=UPI00106F71C3|nr:4a-hydroxytetrahydrobiopterin dehydratase [Ammoniphilus sp. YIM 78166]